MPGAATSLFWRVSDERCRQSMRGPHPHVPSLSTWLACCIACASAQAFQEGFGSQFKAAVALLPGTVGELRNIWEQTSFAIERLQAAEACVDEEQAGLAMRVAPSWHLSFTPTPTPPEKLAAADKVATCHTLGFACFLHAEINSRKQPDIVGFCLALTRWGRDCRCVSQSYGKRAATATGR